MSNMSFGTLPDHSRRKPPYLRIALACVAYVGVFMVPWWISAPFLLATIAYFGHPELLGAALLFDGLFGVPGTWFRTELLLTTGALLAFALHLLARALRS